MTGRGDRGRSTLQSPLDAVLGCGTLGTSDTSRFAVFMMP
jgi:hypothetical protein